MRDKILALISKYRAARLFTSAEEAVLQVIERASKNKPITQAKIAASVEWLGSFAPHEMPKAESTQRRVRAIILELRLRYGLLILASSRGYYIAESMTDAMSFVVDHAEEARAVFKKSMMIHYLLLRHLHLQEGPLFGGKMGLADMTTFEGDDDGEVELLFYLENRATSPYHGQGIPLSMRIGDKPLTYLDGKHVRDRNSISNPYKIEKAFYAGCFCNDGTIVHVPFGWDETGGWELIPATEL